MYFFEALVRDGASITVFFEGCTPLMIASKNGHSSVVQVCALSEPTQFASLSDRRSSLVHKGGNYLDFNQFFLFCCQILLRHWANIEESQGGRTSLLFACANGHLSTVKVGSYYKLTLLHGAVCRSSAADTSENLSILEALIPVLVW